MASSFTPATSFLPKTLTTRRAPFRKIRTASALTVRSIFTGIVEEMGRVRHVGPTDAGGFELRIGASTVLGGVGLGDSISVNGTCLTVSRFDDFRVHRRPLPGDPAADLPLRAGRGVAGEPGAGPAADDADGGALRARARRLHGRDRVGGPRGGLALGQGQGGRAGDDAVHRAERVYYGGRDEPDRGRGL
ncbi:riboflavin synthase-like [Iris pallida]|uniref:Riboflavin synthase-like n=1 Tax=Iris pallida TaxID=29817 RepID=A0AAX6HXB7_IRIPA|nr:riboflavin synthase-like [Iris pallida]